MRRIELQPRIAGIAAGVVVIHHRYLQSRDGQQLTRRHRGTLSMDHLVDYARPSKGQDGQGRASQTQARSTGVKWVLAQFDCTHDNVPPPPMEVLSSADFNKVCDNCGSRHLQFFADVETRKG